MLVDYVISMMTAMWIQTAEPKLPLDKTFEYAELIAEESRRWDINPVTVVAVAWHESNFRNLGNNATNDRGLMQVHWSPRAPWLKGLTKSDLMVPEINIKAGIHELAWWKKTHQSRCKNETHAWYEHYRWGYKVKNRKYGNAIDRKHRILRSSLPKS